MRKQKDSMKSGVNLKSRTTNCLIRYFEVVPNGERIEKVKEIYDDEITGVTRGKEIFHHNICNKCQEIRCE